MSGIETAGQNVSSVYCEVCKVQSVAPIKSKQVLTSGLTFAGNFTGNSNFRNLHTAYMAY